MSAIDALARRIFAGLPSENPETPRATWDDLTAKECEVYRGVMTMSEQPVGEWPDVSMPVAVRRVDANARALAEIRALMQRPDGKPRYLLRRADVLAILDKHGVA